MLEWNLTGSPQSNLRAKILVSFIFMEFVFTILPQKFEINYAKIEK